MSGLLAGKVWQSDLASHLKPLAAALADIANDDGTSIYPSVAYVGWLLGKGRRSVQTGLAELREAQIIEPVGPDKGGRAQTTHYQMIESNLPKRIPWKELRKGAEDAPFTETKGADSDTKGRNSEHERAQFATERAQSVAPDPSVEPLIDPPKEPLDKASLFFNSLKTNPAYSHIDFDRESNKMRAWLTLPENKGRQYTPRFILYWLNKIPAPFPLNGNGNGSHAPAHYVPNDAKEVCLRCFNTGMERTHKGSRPCDHKVVQEVA